MKKLLQICTLLLFISACTEVKRPKDILDEAQFRKVLIDVSLADAYFSQNRISPADSAAFIQQYYDHIFGMHGVKRDEFYRTMKFYLQHPDLLDETMQCTLDSLSTIEANTRK